MLNVVKEKKLEAEHVKMEKNVKVIPQKERNATERIVQVICLIKIIIGYL